MKRKHLWTCLITFGLITLCAFAESEQLKPAQKKKIGTLLTTLKSKAEKSRQEKYEVALPVATAGVRGTQVKRTDRFAVLWPTKTISPLTALAANLKHDMANGVGREELKAQLDSFIKSYPEYKQDDEIKALALILAQDPANGTSNN